jgi:hypothetical protein
VESELRAVGRELDVPPVRDLTAAVRQRLEAQPTRHRRVPAQLHQALRRRPRWRAALVVAAAFLAVVIATPQGRAAIVHVLRFAGFELRQEPGPVRSPTSRAWMPGQEPMTLEQARRQVSFPILVPAALGPPADVVVGDGRQLVSLIYLRTPYGQLRIDEFAGHLDPVLIEKFVQFNDVTKVEVNGTQGLWIKGPHELLYVTPDGTPAIASARLITGNTLIWGTRRVALRLEGNLGKTAALAIADSAR